MDIGPNPVEYLLTALLSCLTTTMVYHAALRGIHIEELESEVEGDLDLQGFFGLPQKGVRNHYTTDSYQYVFLANQREDTLHKEASLLSGHTD